MFTLNNPTEVEITNIKNRLNVNHCHYAIVGKEIGELNTLHLQGFVHFKKQLYFNSVKLILGTRTHVQCARGSDQQNKVYCSKDNNLLLEFGLPSKFFTNIQDDNLIFEIGQRIADGDYRK